MRVKRRECELTQNIFHANETLKNPFKMKTLNIGTFAWAKETGGQLTFKTKIALLARVLAPSMHGMLRTLTRSGKDASLRLDEIKIPDSAAIAHATQELTETASPAVIQHSLRTYLWAAGFAQMDKIRHDPEMLLAGSLLHDLGLTNRHHSQSCQCFTLDSANAAVKTMQRAGWDADRTSLLANIICLHMNGHSTPADGSEAFLLQQATACDIVGTKYYDFKKEFRNAVLSKHPRLKINSEFTSLIKKEKAARPNSRAALIYKLGLPLMVKMNPYSD